jgi:hypothetical protein
MLCTRAEAGSMTSVLSFLCGNHRTASLRVRRAAWSGTAGPRLQDAGDAAQQRAFVDMLPVNLLNENRRPWAPRWC